MRFRGYGDRIAVREFFLVERDLLGQLVSQLL